MDRVFEVTHRYRLDRMLLQRGLASTYAAHDELLEDDVLVEHVPDIDDDDEARRDYVAQYRAVAVRVMRLRHPNVIPIRDFGIDTSGHFLVKQYDPGHALDAHDHQPSPERGRELGAGILRGLAALHHANIVHRDVKRSAIYVVDGPPETAQVDHFHLCVAAELAYLDSQLVGTPVYLAPELLADDGARPYSKASDVYAAGLVCIELATGRSVFDLMSEDSDSPRSLPELLHHVHLQGGHITAEQIRAVINGPIAEVLICATRTDPRDRFPDAKAFYESYALNAPMRIARDDDPASPDALSNLLTRLPDSDLRGELVRAFRIMNIDPRMAVTKCRQVAEVIAQGSYQRHVADPRSKPLVNLVDELHRAGRVPPDVFTHFYNVRKLGNLGVHGITPVTVDGVLHAIAATVRIVTWHLLEDTARSS